MSDWLSILPWIPVRASIPLVLISAMPDGAALERFVCVSVNERGHPVPSDGRQRNHVWCRVDLATKEGLGYSIEWLDSLPGGMGYSALMLTVVPEVHQSPGKAMTRLIHRSLQDTPRPGDRLTVATAIATVMAHRQEEDCMWCRFGDAPDGTAAGLLGYCPIHQRKPIAEVPDAS